MDEYLLSMLQCLENGGDITDDDYINSVSLLLKDKEPLTVEEVNSLDTIVKISNILYNNSDRYILPLEDDLYDLVLEKLKRYKPDYQVGALPVYIAPSAVKPLTKPLIKYDEQELKPALIKLDGKKDPKDMLFFDDINKPVKISKWMVRKRGMYDMTPLTKKNVNTPHKYPKLVGTLDKCKFVLNIQAKEKGVFDDANVQVFERDFIEDHITKGILDPYRKFYMVAELKMDGVSVEAEVSDRVISARSRGDTNNDMATDLTPVLKGYSFPNAEGFIDPDDIFGMKFEAMLGNVDLTRLGYEREKIYKNPRNAVTGLLGSTDANRWRDFLTLVPLATSLDIDRLTELEFMNKYYAREPLRYAVLYGDYKQILFQVKKFVEEAEYLRPIMPFIYDGVVVSYIEPDLIDKLGRSNSVNKYSMAIKFNAMKKQTIFTGYTYSVGQNGMITPIAHYRTVVLFGNDHSKTTAHSVERFKELNLRVGDVVNIELINDVIPYISKADVYENNINPNPLEQFPTHCPCCGTELVFSATGKTAMCPNIACPERGMSIVVNMLAKIGFKDFSEESMKAIGKISSLKDLLKIKIEDLSALGDKEAENFMNRLAELIDTTMYDFRVVGALGFSNVSQQKWQKVLTKLPLEQIISMSDDDLYETLLAIKGVGPVMAKTIVTEREMFHDDLIAILQMPNVVPSLGVSFVKKIRFTGCRDSTLVDELSAEGYDITDGSVTRDTTILLIPEEGYTSAKTKSVSESCIIVPIDEFKNNKDKYLL